jgi:integrase
LHFKMMPLDDISQDSLDEAYQAILRAGVRASPATKVRGVIAPLAAILEYAAVMGWCVRPAFKKPRVIKSPTNFLPPGEANRLIAAAAPYVRPLITFLIGTGCRMSEALELEWKNVDLHGARARVWQKQGNERLVDLPPRVLSALRAIPYLGDEREGAIFRSAPRYDKKGVLIALGTPYRSSEDGVGGGQIKRAWATACNKAELPGAWRVWIPKGSMREKRQYVPAFTPHDCRHTWASAHYVMHHDLLRLKHDGGWSTTAMVERYTHLMPAVYGSEWAAWLESSQ